MANLLQFQCGKFIERYVRLPYISLYELTTLLAGVPPVAQVFSYRSHNYNMYLRMVTPSPKCFGR